MSHRTWHMAPFCRPVVLLHILREPELGEELQAIYRSGNGFEVCRLQGLIGVQLWDQMIKPRCRHLMCFDFRVMIFVFELVKKSKDSRFCNDHEVELNLIKVRSPKNVPISHAQVRQ